MCVWSRFSLTEGLGWSPFKIYGGVTQRDAKSWANWMSTVLPHWGRNRKSTANHSRLQKPGWMIELCFCISFDGWVIFLGLTSNTAWNVFLILQIGVKLFARLFCSAFRMVEHYFQFYTLYSVLAWSWCWSCWSMCCWWTLGVGFCVPVRSIDPSVSDYPNVLCAFCWLEISDWLTCSC